MSHMQWLLQYETWNSQSHHHKNNCIKLHSMGCSTSKTRSTQRTQTSSNANYEVSFLLFIIFVVFRYIANSPVAGEFPSQRPVTWSFDVFFDLQLNKRLSKQSRRRWLDAIALIISSLHWNVHKHPNGIVLKLRNNRSIDIACLMHDMITKSYQTLFK